MNDSTDPFAALDRSIADTAELAKLESRIHRRVRSLMRENGLSHDYSKDKALHQAMLEETGTHGELTSPAAAKSKVGYRRLE